MKPGRIRHGILLVSHVPLLGMKHTRGNILISVIRWSCPHPQCNLSLIRLSGTFEDLSLVGNLFSCTVPAELENLLWVLGSAPRRPKSTKVFFMSEPKRHRPGS